MSTYGFDLDGTLDRPALAQLANDLYDAGHKVYIVTGGLSDAGEWTEVARKEKLAKLGVRYTDILRCMDPDINKLGNLKGIACNEYAISILIDDAYSYLVGAAETSKVVRLMVLP